MNDDLPKLRMAPRESPEELAHRFERERRAVDLQREDRLSQAAGNFRIGSVPYLNAAPLTRGLEDKVILAPPSQLAEMLRREELDAALLSVTEVLFNNRYDVLDEIAVASLGEVKSVFVAHRGPLETMETVWVDPASLTSVSLLKVLLAERGLKPRLEILPGYKMDPMPDNILLIGDPAIEFIRSNPQHSIWDLGDAWYELTRLPFVYAVWVLRRGVENVELKRQLREAWDFGLDTLDSIISDRTEYDYAFRKDYLGWHIHYFLGSDEKRGLGRFIDLLRKHGFGPVYDPRFVK